MPVIFLHLCKVGTTLHWMHFHVSEPSLASNFAVQSISHCLRVALVFLGAGIIYLVLVGVRIILPFIKDPLIYLGSATVYDRMLVSDTFPVSLLDSIEVSARNIIPALKVFCILRMCYNFMLYYYMCQFQQIQITQINKLDITKLRT